MSTAQALKKRKNPVFNFIHSSFDEFFETGIFEEKFNNMFLGKI